MSASGPAPLSAQLVSEYQAAIRRAAPDDWEGHRRRVEAARAIASRAFGQKDRAAWEVTQVLQWQLQKRNHLRPTEPGDVHVLDVLYRVEEAADPGVDLPAMPPRAFAQKLSEDCYALNALETPLLKLMAAGDISRDDFHYFFYQFIPPAYDFTRMLAVGAVRFPYHLALSVYENLGDEAGNGDRERAHFRLLAGDARQFGVEMNERPEALDMIVPEIIANTNCTMRMIWHEDLAWSLGAMFVMERLLPPELTALRTALRAVGAERMEFFDAHIVGDEHHTQEWLDLISENITSPEQQRVTWNAAIRRGEWNRRGWEAIFQGMLQWKRTGAGPRLPFRELREATGIDPFDVGVR